MSEPRRSLRHPDLQPVHPAEILREDVLPALKIPKSQFAAALGISRHMLRGVLTEKRAITADLAVRLGHVLGNGPEIWIGLQRTYDLWHAERNVDTSKLKVLHKPAEAA